MRAVLASATITLTCAACGPSATLSDAGLASDAPSAIDDAAGDAGTREWSFEILETRTVTALGMPREAHLVRASRPDGARSYLLYLPVARAGAPMVVFTQPYAGIDWTGEEVDARWAARGPGAHPDDEAPGYDGDDVIAYEPQTPQQAADASIVWLANQVAVVHAYGRFYAGGSIEDDALDAAAPYHFARTRTELDRAHLGAWGGSWGAFMAMFGAARAPEDAAPIAVGALWGPSDYTDLWAYTDTLPTVFPAPDRAEAFFSTYRRRILATTGGPPPRDSFPPFDRDALCEGLGTSTHVLSLHDDWDTLVPVAQTRSLVDACGAQVTPLYWHRQSEVDYFDVSLDHGVSFRDEAEVPTAYTFSHAFVLDRLIPSGPIYVIANEPALAAFLETVHAEQLAGGDASDALPMLRTLAEERISAFTPAGMFEPAGDLLARAATTVYGRPYTAASLRAQLETSLPAP
jgi:hypothetical protein